MSTPTNNTLLLTYTAPDSPEVGQQIASAALGGPLLKLVAGCDTQIVVAHPPGQKLRLAEGSPRSDCSEQQLVVTLPANEDSFDLDFVAEPSGTALKVTVTTKKMPAKPDPPSRGTF